MPATSEFDNREAQEHQEKREFSPAMHHYLQRSIEQSTRLAELEMENFRLQRLVAELLVKNQQLRGTD
jgi:hypothetical protein